MSKKSKSTKNTPVHIPLICRLCKQIPSKCGHAFTEYDGEGHIVQFPLYRSESRNKKASNPAMPIRDKTRSHFDFYKIPQKIISYLNKCSITPKAWSIPCFIKIFSENATDIQAAKPVKLQSTKLAFRCRKHLYYFTAGRRIMRYPPATWLHHVRYFEFQISNFAFETAFEHRLRWPGYGHSFLLYLVTVYRSHLHYIFQKAYNLSTSIYYLLTFLQGTLLLMLLAHYFRE